MILSRFQITASAVKSEPSWNFTPSRSLKIHLVLPGSPSSRPQLAASPGTSPDGFVALDRSQLISAS